MATNGEHKRITRDELRDAWRAGFHTAIHATRLSLDTLEEELQRRVDGGEDLLARRPGSVSEPDT
jgi:hypothetical protein